MAEHKSTSRIPIPEECEHPMDELKIFFRTNRYALESEDEEEGKAVLVRGQKGKGFWTSDLTVLPTRLELELMDEFIWARYEVDTSGQRLTDEDRSFWTREATAAITFLETGETVNLVQVERDRADQIRADFARKGVFLGGVVAFVLFVFLVFLLT